MAMSPEDNTVIVRRFWEEVFNEGNLEIADELFASDHIFHQPNLSEEEHGPGVVKGVVAVLRKISSDIQVIIEDEIAAGDKVVTRWRASGTLTPELRSAEEIT